MLPTGHGLLPNGSSATRCPPQITSNAASWLFLYSKLKNYEYLHSTPTPRITAQISQILQFWAPVLSGGYDVRGGRHTTIPLKTKENLHPIHFLPHRDAWDNVICSTGKETFFLTDSSQQNKHSWIAHEWKFGGSRIWFGINFSQQRNFTWNNNGSALRTKLRNITNGLGRQDSRGGVNSTYVHLRSIRAVHFSLIKSCGLTEQSVNVVSSVPTIMADPSLKLTKQRPAGLPYKA